jgi:quercetin dioxygenase-like cupin family protein
MEWASGNVFIRPNSLERAGDQIAGHAHAFDHTSIVMAGAVRIAAKLPDGPLMVQEFRAPSHVLIRAGVEHEITALEDGTVFWCVYAHRTPQGEVVQEYTGWWGAYG